MLLRLLSGGTSVFQQLQCVHDPVDGVVQLVGNLRGEPSHRRKLLRLDEGFPRFAELPLNSPSFTHVLEDPDSHSFISFLVINEGGGKLAFYQFPVLSSEQKREGGKFSCAAEIVTPQLLRDLFGNTRRVDAADIHFPHYLFSFVTQHIFGAFVEYEDRAFPVCHNDAVHRAFNHFVFDLTAQLNVFPNKPSFLNGVPDLPAQVVGVDRFRDIVVGSILESLDGGIH